ncbi:MAG: cache domain-containing protein [Deltaproteobacteria bacterium]|nr:cache domain-containing protein [Deltaproteobacteria bacterium]
MTPPDILKPLAGGSVRSASLRIVIPVGLTLILFILSVFFLFIPSIEKQMTAQKREMIRNLTDSCWSLLAVYHDRVREGELSLEEAQSRVVQRMRGMRYGPDGKDYFWINDMTPRLVMHPYRPDLEGTDLSDYVNREGRHLFLEFVKTVKGAGAGYVDYMWQWKDNPDRVVPKISYVRGFEPWGWIIGTGIYVEDIRADILSITGKMVAICSGILAVVLALSLFIVWQAIKTETARRDAEKGLMEREKEFRALGEDAPFGISITGTDQRHEYLNPKFTRIFGYTMTDVPDKKTWFEKAYPDPSYRDKVIAAWKQDVVRHPGAEEVKPRVFTVRCKNGEEKIIQFRAVAMKTGKLLLTCEDITQQARMEESLKKSEQSYIQLYDEAKRREELYGSLLHSSADAIVIYDIDGNVQYVSPAFTRIFGWTQEEIEGKRIPFLPDPEKEQSMRIIRELVDYGTPCHGFETKRFTKDGRLLDVSISASRYDDHEGNPSGMLVILRDISETKALESQFYEAQKMESIGTLAGGVAHDFNNLLMAIQGNVSLLLLDKDASHPDQKRLHNIEEHIQRGASLTRQLLGFARAGKYEIKPTNLNEIARQSIDLFSRMKKEIKIRSTYQKDIWMIEADQGQIEQVLMNLYVNAGHAMPEGGDLIITTQNLTIPGDHPKPSGLRPGKYVKLSVTDTGVGMDEDTLQKIFDPFFTTREVGQGTGLGLASAYGIIKNHSGSIIVRSAEGKGTTFDLFLPAVEAKEITKTREIDPPLEITPGGGTILLVDDEEIVIEVGEEMLRRLGYTVLSAGSGREAVKLCRSHRRTIDLVILDMIMPDMPGVETYDRLKQEAPDLLVLLSSGYSIDGQATEILKHGCNGFIQKPFTMAALSKKIREVLAK